MVPLEAYVSKYTLDTNTALVSGNTYVEVTQLASVRVELVVVEFGELFFMGSMLVGTQRERGTEREVPQQSHTSEGVEINCEMYG